MALLFRWMLRLTIALLALVVAGSSLLWYFTSRSLPNYDASFTLSGPSAEMEIIRDTANVPHIMGHTDADSFFGLGFAHAQDRLWQMIQARRTVQGRLSELYGSSTFAADSLMRRLDLYGAAESSLAHQDEAALEALHAYADGVNAWLNEINKGAFGRGAPELWLFNHAIAPWQPVDSLALMKLLAFQMNGQIDAEVLRARASLQLPPERLRDLLPETPGTALTALPRYADLIQDVPRYAQATDLVRQGLSPLPPPGQQGASNAWAAAPARSATGGTLLANDPHSLLTAPSQWYLARLSLRAGDVIGASIPGIPLLFSGRSNQFGWGITASYLDDLDIYIEEVNAEDVTQYRGLEGYIPFETRDTIIAIKDEAPVTLRLQWTQNGPVLPPDMFGLGSIRPAGHVTSIAWTGFSPEDRSYSAGLRLMKAQTVAGAVTASEGFIAPALNVTLADRATIGLKSLGAFPLRHPDHASQGRLPSYGYFEQNRWQGILPHSEAPEFINPPGGILGNTNNKITDEPFPRHMSYVWGDSQRIERWTHLMQLREVHTRQSFIETQLDTVSYSARALLPLIGADLWFTGEAAPEGSRERRRQIALTLLAEWNGEMNEHLPEPLIYMAWLRALQDRLIRDDIGPLADHFTHIEPIFLERVFRNEGGAAAWCDILQSAPVESCTDLARMALDDAIVWISETYGAQLEALRWGDAHIATSNHPVLGQTPLLHWFVNIHQSSSGSDSTLMRGLTAGTGANPYLNVHAASYRGVYDFSDPENSVFILSTGQSGHPLSRHYDDLGERWRRGEYVPMSLDTQLARAGAVGVTRLIPLP